MNLLRYALMLLLTGILMTGCAAESASRGGASSVKALSKLSSPETEVRFERMLIWRANLELEVPDLPAAIARATAIAEANGGYFEQKSEGVDHRAHIRLRIPVANFKSAVGALEELGSVTYRSVTGEDVTEQYIDIEARLKNRVALRDRLQLLLNKATDVKDILAIETELNRVQSDIDAMSGKMKALKGQVEYATVDLSMKRPKILGPLGYLFKGVWWGVTKLFVLRD
jgi:hypothetical protein